MDDYIQHYGILGMHWGIRRSPEELGYTRKPSRRYRKQAKKEYKTAVKNRSLLSNKSLSDRINRVENENRLKRSTKENISPVKKEVDDFLKVNGKKVLGTVFVGASLYAAKKFVTKKFGKEAGEFVSRGKVPEANKKK